VVDGGMGFLCGVLSKLLFLSWFLAGVVRASLQARLHLYISLFVFAL